ncbi:TPA: hypothetical protein HA244_06795 [Candidatus Micrarchaeota archaeon]|nr:hypothetical protein [Candidatus Micrarchaeota archaeon]
MKTEQKVVILLIPLFALLLAPMIFADYAQTKVFFNVASSTAFRVTLPGQALVTSNATQNPSSPPTADIEFNTTSITANNIFPAVAGGTAQSGAGATGTPIFQYTNVGNVNISLTLIFNQSLPTGVTVRANSSWNQTSTWNGTAYTGDVAVNDTGLAVVGHNLTFSGPSYLNVYLYANFSSVQGSRNVRLLNHTSTTTPGTN